MDETLIFVAVFSAVAGLLVGILATIAALYFRAIRPMEDRNKLLTQTLLSLQTQNRVDYGDKGNRGNNGATNELIGALANTPQYKPERPDNFKARVHQSAEYKNTMHNRIADERAKKGRTR